MPYPPPVFQQSEQERSAIKDRERAEREGEEKRTLAARRRVRDRLTYLQREQQQTGRPNADLGRLERAEERYDYAIEQLVADPGSSYWQDAADERRREYEAALAAAVQWERDGR
jgi:hypothetical protein